MKNKRFTSSFFFLAGTAMAFSQPAFSDATVVYEQHSGSQKSINTMQVKDGKIRFTPPGQNDNYSLYDSKSGTLTHIDLTQKKYLVMNESDIIKQASQAKKQMDVMRQRMMDRMKDMPPEQKKQIEQMMNNHLSRVTDQPAPIKVEQKKTSRTETINGIACTVHESYTNGMKNSELCIASADEMGLNSQDTQTLMAMQAFMKQMQKMAKAMVGSNAESTDVQGIPLHTKLFASDGSIKLETRMTSISKADVSSEKVSVPAGFTAMPMPTSGMK